MRVKIFTLPFQEILGGHSKISRSTRIRTQLVVGRGYVPAEWPETVCRMVPNRNRIGTREHRPFPPLDRRQRHQQVMLSKPPQ